MKLLALCWRKYSAVVPYMCTLHTEDITSKPGTNPSKIRTIVCDIVKKYANSNYLKKLIFSRLFI